MRFGAATPTPKAASTPGSALRLRGDLPGKGGGTGLSLVSSLLAFPFTRTTWETSTSLVG